MTTLTPREDSPRPTRSLNPGLYRVDDEGQLHLLPAGSWSIDEEGHAVETSGWKAIVDRIPWERADAVFGTMNKWSAVERIASTLLTLTVAAGIIGAAVYLAAVGIVEGQAVVGFLGAAIGYLLARARHGG